MLPYRKLNAARKFARHSALLLAPMFVAAVLPAQAPARTPATSGSAHPGGNEAQEIVSLIAVASRDEIEAGKLALGKATRSDVKSYAQRMIDEHTKTLRTLGDSAAGGGWIMPDSSMTAGGMGSGSRSGTSSGSAMGGTAGSTASSSTASGSTGSGSTGSGSASGSGSMARSGNMSASGSGAASTSQRMGDSTMRAAQGTGNDARQLHAANTAAMKKLQSASGAAFDQAYVASQVEGHAGLLAALNKHTTSNPKLQAMATQTKATVQHHLEDARKLQSSAGAK